MVMKMRSAIGIATIWLAAVAGVSVTAWVAIDRAGRDITGGVVSSLPPVTLGPVPGTTTPGGGSSRTDATPETSATTGTPAPTAPSATPEPFATQEPSATEPATTPRDRTFSVTGGQVSVRCTGSTIRLRIAQPDNGWRVEVEQAGPEEVHVIFSRGDDEDEAQVAAVCASGNPVLRVEEES
jgi:hypothetical protein